MPTQQNKKRIETAKNNIVQASTSLVESLNSGTVYTLFGIPLLTHFFVEFAKYILLPITVIAGIIQSILAWRQAQLENYKTRGIVHAGIETAAALALGVTLIGSLVAETLFAAAVPIVFTVVVATKTLYHIGATFHYGHKSKNYYKPNKTHDEIEQKKDEAFELAQQHAVSTVAGVVATVATTAVFLLGEIALACLGAGLAIVGTIFAVYKGVKAFQSLQEIKSTQNADPTKQIARIGSQHAIHQQLGITHYTNQQTARTRPQYQNTVGIPVNTSQQRKRSQHNEHHERHYRHSY